MEKDDHIYWLVVELMLVFDHIGITQKDLWNTPVCVCVNYSLRGNQRVNQTQGKI